MPSIGTTSSGVAVVMKAANIAAMRLRSSSASSYWSSKNSRTRAGVISGTPRIWPGRVHLKMCSTYFTCGHSHRLQQRLRLDDGISGVDRIEPIGDTATAEIQFDAVHDVVAVGGALVFLVGAHLALKELDLQPTVQAETFNIDGLVRAILSS